MCMKIEQGNRKMLNYNNLILKVQEPPPPLLYRFFLRAYINSYRVFPVSSVMQFMIKGFKYCFCLLLNRITIS